VSRFEDQVTSTEKLLELIRNRNGAAAPKFEEQTTSHHITSRFNPLNFFRFSKIPTVGVDIGHQYIRMVKTARMPDGQWRLMDKGRVSLPEGLSRKDPEFAGFLKTSLTRFRGSSKRMNLWTNISAAGVDVRYTHIPKVSGKQIETAVYWTIRKDTTFDEKEYIFDYELQGEVIDQGVPKLSVMIYTAPRSELEELRNLFHRSGFPLSGISITPFALQNLFRTKWLPFQDSPVASLLVGNDYSRIDIFHQGKLVMTRGIKAGTRSMLDSLQEKLSEHTAANAVKDENLPPLTREQARELLYSISPDTLLDEKPDDALQLTTSDIFHMVLPAINRLVQQVERTFEYFGANSGYGKVNNLYISSAMNMYRPLADYIGDQLGIEKKILDPLGHKISQALPASETIMVTERIALIPALALALSDPDHTPNFIFTFRDREKQAGLARINKLILTGFIVSLMICAGIFIYQGHLLKVRITQRDRVARELARFTPRLDQVEVMRMAGMLKSQHPDGERYLSMAVISELSGLTPFHIQLLSVRANLNEALKTKAAETTKNVSSTPVNHENSKTIRLLEIEGIINGERKILESLLAQYVMKLDASPLFGEISIQKNDIEPLGKTEILHFTLNAKIT